jgi:ketosteroid isomerase-like protein
MQAWLNKDTQTCNRILSDDFTLSSARGMLVTKSEWLEAARTLITGEAFYWDEIKVRLYGNTAVVNAKTRQTAKVGSQDWSGAFLITDVWVYQNNNWQVVSRHGTGPLKLD